MFEKLLKSVFGSKHDRDLKRTGPLVDEINDHYEAFHALSDEELRGKTAEFRARIAEALKEVPSPEEGKAVAPEERKTVEREVLDEILPEAFAAVKEACRRLCGRSWDVVGIP